MKSTSYTRFCLKLFGRFFKKYNPERLIEKNILLEKANILLDFPEFVSQGILTSILIFLFTFINLFIIYLLLPNPILFILLITVPLLAFMCSVLFYWYLPEMRIKQRGRQIDLFLPYAINFINSMAVAGISPSEIFTTLAKINLYGDLQHEAKKIAKEINIMGVDNISALKHAIDVSPSKKLKAFLQGIIGTIQAGSELHLYLETVVEKFMEEDLVDRKRDLDLLAIIAEVFVIAVIAFPIFLVIILTVFGFFGGSMDLSISILTIFSLLVLPIIYTGFYYLIKSTSLEEISRVTTKEKISLKTFMSNFRQSLIILGLSAGLLCVFYVVMILFNFFNIININFYTQLDFLFLGILFLIGPLGIYNYLEIKKKFEIQQRLPEFLTEVGDSLNTGMTIFDSIKVASKAHYGLLTSEITRMKAQLSWDISMREVFVEFAQRMKSAIIHRIVITVNRGLSMGGNTPKIFKAASREVSQVNRLENQRQVNMSVYTLVILVCFFVFLAIVVILDRTIFSSFFALQEKQTVRLGSFALSLFDPLVLKYSLFLFVFVQSIGAGVLSGFMMDGKLSSGIRFSCLLGLVSFFVFKFMF